MKLRKNIPKIKNNKKHRKPPKKAVCGAFFPNSHSAYTVSL